MESKQTWRELLGDLIESPQERVRIATALGVNPATLVRWANNETNPRLPNLRRLVQHVAPQYRAPLSEYIQQEFPDFLRLTEWAEWGEGTEQIPAGFYASVLEAVAVTGADQRFFTISNRVLKQALGQLDPNNVGMVLSIAKCLSPVPGRKVRSLREVTGTGTPPWQSTITQEALFLGIESLAGYALTKGRTFIAATREESLGFYAVRWEESEQSAMACPILQEGRYAGCLIASSAQPGYFLPYRQVIMEHSARLVALAFRPVDFYDQRDIQLLTMPSREVQIARAGDFRQRLSQVLLQASSQGQMIHFEQAEQQVWQDLESELLGSAAQVYQ